jgi:hypothetical protein
MDDLIKMITEKTGISMDQAKGAIETVMGFIGDKLPGPIADQVKGLIGGGEGGDAGGGDVMDKAKDALGGFFGGGDK